MKKAIIVIMVLLVAGLSYGAITSTEAELKVGDHLKTIYETSSNAKESLTRVYNDIKTYIDAHANQFTAADKTALNGLEADMLSLNNSILTVLTNIETNFPGLIEE